MEQPKAPSGCAQPRINRLAQCSLLVEIGGSRLGGNMTVDGLHKTDHVVAFTSKLQGSALMTRSLPFQAVVLTTAGFGALCAGGGVAHAGFNQTNLVSDLSGIATLTDPNLINPWGVRLFREQPRFGSRTRALAPQACSL
jgi:hypothetical protein